MADCPQINNTTIIGTSAVSYDSTPLPCTGVSTCDDLNTILAKFDNVICSAINSVNILSEEIMNITEDIMIITEEIENINNQIFICCPICDFTITATELPVCEFTATATELPICDFTGSVNEVLDCLFTVTANQLPDPTTTTTSSSSTSTTTTTTTAEPTTTTTTTTVSCIEGDLVLANETVGSTIVDVYAAVWAIATPTPVPPGATYDGAQGGTSDPINVDVTVTQVSCISLYINCVKIESIEVPSTGTYTFAATNILNADAVTIILTETGTCL